MGKKTNNKNGFSLGPAEIIPYRLAFKFISDPLTTLNKISTKYGDISHFKFGPKTHVYLVNDPYLIEDILVRSNRCFIKSPGLKLARHVIGNGLLINEGENHTNQRKIIQPAFSKDNIKTYGNIISELSIRYINTNWNDREIVNIYREMTKLTLNIISELLFGSNKITKEETEEISD